MKSGQILAKLRVLKRYFLSDKSSLTPGAPFDAEQFLLLLLSQQKGLTTRQEDEYIRVEIERNEEAAGMFRDLQNTYPEESFELTPRRRPKKWAVAAVILFFVVVTGTLYSLSRHYRILIIPVQEVKENTVYQIENKSIREIAGILERHYKVKVYFDSERVADYHFYGIIDTGKPIEVFLGDLQFSGIEYLFDEKGNIHFK